jgi:imidazole glycerol-phosphate synthase subunit HisF
LNKYYLFEMPEKSPYKKGGMFDGASPLIFERAKDLRKNMTEAEKVLWFHLKQNSGGFKFRRQHPLGIYIADFYCHKAKLVIELDGTIHDDAEE